MSGLVRALYFSGLQDQAHALRTRAVEIAQRVGDPATLVYCLNLTVFSNQGPQFTDERLAASKEIMGLAANTGNTEGMLDVYSWFVEDLLEIGDELRMASYLRSFQREAERVRQPFYRYVVHSLRSSLAVAQGRFDEGEELAKQALLIGERMRGQDPAGVFGMKMFTIRREQGRLQEIMPAVKIFLQQSSANQAWRPGLALIYSELGMEAEARSEFEQLAANDFSALPQDALLPVCLAYMAEVCAFLKDVHGAEVLYQQLSPWEGHNIIVPGGVGYYGAASRYLGLLASIVGRWETAERHFQDALEMDTRMSARTWLAHVQHDYAQMLLDRAQPGDRDKAASLADKAMAMAQELGMGLLETRLIDLQQRLKPSPARGAVYPAGLTQREVEVLRLVASGRTDRQIADELFISVGTVNTHVKNILYKTNCANRTEAATFAASHGLL